jgi:hypothetical protein
LTAITDPRDPGTLFTTSAVAAAPARWRNFILPGSLFALLLLCSAIAYFVSRHHV